MDISTDPGFTDEDYRKAARRVKKIKDFYKNLAWWFSTSIFMVLIDLVTSGGITWSRFPVFFWGISIAMSAISVFRYQRHDKEWEKRQLEKQLGRPLPSDYVPMTDLPKEDAEDYTDQLLNQKEKERQKADLTQFRKLPRPWKEDDLV